MCLNLKKIEIFTLFFSFFMTASLIASESKISGQALYLDRIALPQNAVFKATLEDVSLMDAPSVTLGSVTVSPAGQVPIPFEIIYNRDDIKKGHSYSVRGKITVDEKLIYITDTSSFVLNGKDDSHIKLMMKRIQKRSQKTDTSNQKRVMLGMYRYMADAAMFQDCTTGMKLPVLFEKDNLALEKAYLKDQKNAGALLKVQLEGKIVQRPKMEGEGMQSHLLVERFIKTMPNEHCGNQHVDASFSNTYWKLTALLGEGIQTKSNQREAHIIFKPLDDGEGKFKGTTGCNVMFGSYEMEDKNVSINHKQVALTRMVCPDSKIEKSFLLALKETVHWQVKGDHLELMNESSKVLARFEAVYF